MIEIFTEYKFISKHPIKIIPVGQAISDKTMLNFDTISARVSNRITRAMFLQILNQKKMNNRFEYARHLVRPSFANKKILVKTE